MPAIFLSDFKGDQSSIQWLRTSTIAGMARYQAAFRLAAPIRMGLASVLH
jgi:hypothetical protein